MMTLKSIEDYLEQFVAAESSYPFGPEALVFKIKGKMFALTSQTSDEPYVTLKCTPADGEVLVSEFDAIRPGYHMNKRHWISIAINGDVDETMLQDLATQSYKLVVSKLKKSDREELNNSNQ